MSVFFFAPDLHLNIALSKFSLLNFCNSHQTSLCMFVTPLHIAVVVFETFVFVSILLLISLVAINEKKCINSCVQESMSTVSNLWPTLISL